MTWTPKHPASKELFGWDFSEQLSPGSTLATFNGITIDVGDDVLVISGGVLSGDDQVHGWLEGGTDGKSYLVRAEAVASNGERLEVANWLSVSRLRGAL